MTTAPSRLHVIPGALACLLVAAAAVCLRQGLPEAGLGCAAAALLAALAAGLAGGHRALGVLPTLAVLAAAIAGMRAFGEAGWPCPVSCQGGGAYQRLLGVPAWAWAVAGELLVALLVIVAWRRPQLDRAASIAAGLAWLLAGGSLFYLWTGWLLGLRCPYCWAAHAGILAAALVAVRAAAPRWWLKGVLLFVGFAALFLAYAPSPTEEHRALPTPAVPAARKMSDLIAGIEAIRRLGAADAPLRAEIAIDPHCPHCATTLGPLLAALKPEVDAGRLTVVQRFLTRPADPSGRDLALHLLATRDQREFALVLSLLLGTPEERGWKDMRGRVGEIADPAAIEKRALDLAPALEVVILADAERLARIGCTQTPFAILTGADGIEIGRWTGDALDPAAVAAAAAAARPAKPTP